jgi:hypothetical protein
MQRPFSLLSKAVRYGFNPAFGLEDDSEEYLEMIDLAPFQRHSIMLLS